MREELEIDGIKYVLKPYSFGVDLEISDRAFEMKVDEITGKVLATTKTGIVMLLGLVNSLESWTFRGLNENDELITDQEKPVLEINEENVRKLPSRHGNTLSKLAKKINNMGELEVKN